MNRRTIRILKRALVKFWQMLDALESTIPTCADCNKRLDERERGGQFTLVEGEQKGVDSPDDIT